MHVSAPRGPTGQPPRRLLRRRARLRGSQSEGKGGSKCPPRGRGAAACRSSTACAPCRRRRSAAAAPFHNITQMVKSPPSEASRRPTLRPGQSGTRRDGQELAHSFVPPRVVEECLNITCWVRTSFLATHVRDPLKVELAPGNNACTYVGLMLMLLLDYSTWPCLGPA